MNVHTIVSCAEATNHIGHDPVNAENVQTMRSRTGMMKKSEMSDS